MLNIFTTSHYKEIPNRENIVFWKCILKTNNYGYTVFNFGLYKVFCFTSVFWIQREHKHRKGAYWKNFGEISLENYSHCSISSRSEVLSPSVWSWTSPWQSAEDFSSPVWQTVCSTVLSFCPMSWGPKPLVLPLCVIFVPPAHTS